MRSETGDRSELQSNDVFGFTSIVSGLTILKGKLMYESIVLAFAKPKVGEVKAERKTDQVFFDLVLIVAAFGVL